MRQTLVKILTPLFFSYPLLLISDLTQLFLCTPPLIAGYIIYTRKRFVFMIVSPKHFINAYEEYFSSAFAEENDDDVEMIVYHESAEEFTKYAKDFGIDIEDQPLE